MSSALVFARAAEKLKELFGGAGEGAEEEGLDVGSLAAGAGDGAEGGGAGATGGAGEAGAGAGAAGAGGCSGGGGGLMFLMKAWPGTNSKAEGLRPDIAALRRGCRSTTAATRKGLVVAKGTHRSNLSVADRSAASPIQPFT